MNTPIDVKANPPALKRLDEDFIQGSFIEHIPSVPSVSVSDSEDSSRIFNPKRDLSLSSPETDKKKQVGK